MLKSITQKLFGLYQKQLSRLLVIFSSHFPKSLIIGIIFSVVIRLICVPNKSSDFQWALTSWYNFIVEHGGLSALKESFSDYTPAYLYWLVIAATLLSDLPKVFSIKLLAIVFDFICAFFVYKIVQLKYPDSRRTTIAFLLVLFTPTVVYNSSLWGQCDVIYTTGIIACLYFLCIQKETIAFISFGLAISFKLQAIFFLPFLGMLLVKSKVSWKSFLLIPLVYMVSVLPAWFVGHPFFDLLLIYARQGKEYKKLVMNAPNFYQWIPQDWYQWVLHLGLLFSIVSIAFLIYKVYKTRIKLGQEEFIELATISVLLVPYLLPKMHERYFFAADIMSLIYGIYFPERFWVAITVQLSSFFSYLGTPIFPKIFSFVLGVTIWFVLKKSEIICPTKREGISK